jgi:AraC-like DNA-binding protein
MKKNSIHPNNQVNSPMKDDASDRWVVEHVFEEIPELQVLGFDNLKRALPLTEHQHPDAFEFVFIEKGQAAWEIENNRFYTRTGDVFHAKPGELHRGSYDIIEPCRFWWLILKAPSLETQNQQHNKNWLQLSPTEAELLLKRLWGLPRVVSISITNVNILWRLRKSIEKRDALSSLECRLTIVDFLLQLLHPTVKEVIAEDIQQNLKDIIEQIYSEPDWRPSVPELAALAGVSTSYFYRIFQELTGLAPMTYIERVRIEEACRRLTQTSDSITRISLDLGYSSSQHFATVFKRITGRSPSEWR